MNDQRFSVRNALPGEFAVIGNLMVSAYSQLEGFPKETEQPAYYKMLSNVGDLTQRPDTDILVAVTDNEEIAGAVVLFGDMRYYGSGGMAVHEKDAAGFRLLAVDPSKRGKGVGKLLVVECIKRSKEKKHTQLIIHTTKAMRTAWVMYESMGFRRSADLDFTQGDLQIFGFRLSL